MIKLIATDLDGTLLNSERRLPNGIFGAVTELLSCGVLFAPASGRQYANVKKLFAPVADDILFICENGALVKYKDKTIFLNPIPDGDAVHALEQIRAIPHLFPMLCCEENAYIENAEEPFYSCATASYDNCVKVNSLNDVIGREHVCKIAIYDELGSAAHCIKELPPRLKNLHAILSGADWCDVAAPSSNKGAAIRFIRKKFSLQREECVSFGDHMNDFEMLSECGFAYVTENAYPPLKQRIGNTVPSNTDGGVFQKILEILGDVKKEKK